MKHDHDHDAEDKGRRDERLVPPDGPGPGGLSQLQRSVGNAVTSRFVEFARRAAEVGEEPSVQRSSVDEVVGSRGDSLPVEVKRVAEAGYGDDFSGVRVHRDAVAVRSAREFGARAYTTGEHVVMPPGNDDLHTWLHELDHVRQQRRGAVEGTDRGDGVQVSHPSDRHEKEADTNATRALRGDRPTARAGSGAVGGAGRSAVQRVLKVGGNTLPTRSGGHSPQARQVWHQVAALGAFQARSAEDQAAMEAQFWKWVDEKPGTPTGHSPWGRKQQQRDYGRIEDLEAGLHGWVAAKPERHTEKEYAESIAENPDVGIQLNSILYRVLQKVDSLAESADEDVQARHGEVLRELKQVTTLGPKAGDPRQGNVERPRGWYQYYLTIHGSRANPEIMHTIRDGVLEVMLKPTKYTFLDKIVVLHDLMEYFGDQRPWNPPGAGTGMLPAVEPELIHSTKDIQGGVRSTTPDRGRSDQGTRNEQASSTRFARQHNLPVWSGASNTTAHMLNLTRWVEATRQEMTALAHSIFAFWRMYYDHTSLAPHTLHEVMDVAQNFGVPYDPLDRYEGLGHEDEDAEHTALRSGVQHRIDDVISMLDELNEVWEGRDDATLDTFLQPRDQLLTALRNFTANFDAASTPDERRRVIMITMHAATHTDLAIRQFVRQLQASGFFDSDSGSDEA